jgi:hypothetical protein
MAPICNRCQRGLFPVMNYLTSIVIASPPKKDEAMTVIFLGSIPVLGGY